MNERQEKKSYMMQLKKARDAHKHNYARALHIMTSHVHIRKKINRHKNSIVGRIIFSELW